MSLLFDDVLRARRSVRAFKPDPVPLALVRELLDCARRAPSGTNIQPWKVHVVAGEVRRRLEFEINRQPPGDRVDIRPHPLMTILGERLLPRLRRRLGGLPDRQGARWLGSPLDLSAVLADPKLSAEERGRCIAAWGEWVGHCFDIISDDTPIPVIRPGAELLQPGGPAAGNGTPPSPLAASRLGSHG